MTTNQNNARTARALTEKHLGDTSYAQGNPESLITAVQHYERALSVLESNSTEVAEIRGRLNRILNIPYRKINLLLFRSVPPYQGRWKVLSQPTVFIILLILIIIIPLSINPLRQFINHHNCGGTIIVNGSTAFSLLLEQAATNYKDLECSGADITIEPSSSKTGLDKVYQGSVTIGASDIFADQNQTDPKLVDKGKQRLIDYQIAGVVFVLVVNSDVTINNLSSRQIRGIYSGGYSTWGEVLQSAEDKPGGNLENLKTLKITQVSRPHSSGTRATFEKYVLDGTETVSGPSRLESDTNQLVAQSVCDNPGAIGYVSLYYARQYASKCSLHILSIDHYDPTNPQLAELIKNNRYSFWSIEHLYTRENATGFTMSFINYVINNSKQYFQQYNYLDLESIAAALPSHSFV